ncbi:MAG: D-aminoacyl-tRNA deacylase [Myxococcota bacterium]
MRALIQRVARAKVTVGEEITGQIGPGILVFLGIHAADTEETSRWMARKCAQLRIFEDEAKKMNRSVIDIGGEALVVSQFTLYGDAQKGNRPSYIEAAPPEIAAPAYERFLEHLGAELGKPVGRGRFGAEMMVDLVNAGPVTIWLESKAGPA